jgi:hypothetical protein
MSAEVKQSGGSAFHLPRLGACGGGGHWRGLVRRAWWVMVSERRQGQGGAARGSQALGRSSSLRPVHQPCVWPSRAQKSSVPASCLLQAPLSPLRGVGGLASPLQVPQQTEGQGKRVYGL